MKRMIGIVMVLLTLVSPGLAQWHAWGVHGAWLHLTLDGTEIGAYAGINAQYHWDKSSWPTQIGQKAYVSTSQFNGMTIENAITSVAYDITSGDWSNVNFHIIVEDGGGRKAVVTPATNSAVSAGFNVGTVTNDFNILEAEAGWTGTAATGANAANWNDIKDLVIATGPAPDLPDTLNGDAAGPGDLSYDPQNWEDWADDSGQLGAQEDGFLLAFGQSTGAATAYTVIDNLTISGNLVILITKPDGSTYAPMQVTETSALFRGYILDDGGATCSYRFQYWRADDKTNKKQTEWECCYGTGTFCGARVTDLLPGTAYCYTLEISNGYADYVWFVDERCFTTLGVAPPPEPEEELVAHYLFSGNALDDSGNNNHGLVLGNPNFLVDMIGGLPRTLIGLDGVDDTVQIPRSISESWTMALWLRTDDPGRDGPGGSSSFENGFGVVSGALPGYLDDFGLSFQNYSLSYGVGTTMGPGTTIVAANAIVDTEWHHVAAVRNATNGYLALFVDGQQAMNLVPDPNNPANTIPIPVEGYGPVGPKEASVSLFVGGTNLEFGKYLFGELADLRLYNHVLDEAAIAGLAGFLSVKPMEDLYAVSDPVHGLPLTAVLLDSIPTWTLVLGTTTFAGPPLWPQFPSYQADNFNLDAPSSADGQAYMVTLFPQPVNTIFLLERGADDSGYIQALDSGGVPLGVKIPFGPSDFWDTGKLFLGQKGGGLRIDAGTPIHGIVIFPPDGGPMGIDPVSISGIPVMP